MMAKHGPEATRFSAWRSRVADRLFDRIKPKYLVVLALVLGLAAFAFLAYTSSVTLKDQRTLKKAQNQIENERQQRRSAVNQGICAIIDAVPPGNDRIDSARTQFSCGIYQQPGAKPGIGLTPKPGGSAPPNPSSPSNPLPTGSRSTPGTLGPGVAPTPSHTGSVNQPASASTATRITTRTAPATTRTRTVTSSPTRTPGLLPLPGCTISVLGINVCNG